MAAKIYQAHKLKSLPARHVALWRHLGGEITPRTRSHDSSCVHEKESPADRMCSVGLFAFQDRETSLAGRIGTCLTIPFPPAALWIG